MSGILKRKFEEVAAGPSPCLSLGGLDEEDEDISCGDSGNSSDSLNPALYGAQGSPPVPKQGKRARAARGRVHFASVTVYYFSRRQGFTSVPTQGGSTLGMSPQHSWVQHFTLGEFAVEQERSHKDMLREHLKEEKLNSLKLQLTKNGTVPSAEADTLTLDHISEEDLHVDTTAVDEYFFLQPLTTRRRRALLRSAGVRRIAADEKHELRALRVSREECGCDCRGRCDPDTCACSLAGIKCQVDRMSFPCGCSKEGCRNVSGRLEFNPVRVRTHFLHTIMKLQLERSREQQQQQQVSNSNGYHGDPLVQQTLQYPPTNADPPPQTPSMHLRQAVNGAEPQLEEDEEEDEDEYYEDDDNSSLCSGLSDCTTHSLETSEPEEEEEEEEDDEEEMEEDEEEEEEEEWGEGRASPTPVSLMAPLSPVMGYRENTQHPSSYLPSSPTQYYDMDSVQTPLPPAASTALLAFKMEGAASALLPDSSNVPHSPRIPQYSQIDGHETNRRFLPTFKSELGFLQCSNVGESSVAPCGQTNELQLSFSHDTMQSEFYVETAEQSSQGRGP